MDQLFLLSDEAGNVSEMAHPIENQSTVHGVFIKGVPLKETDTDKVCCKVQQEEVVQFGNEIRKQKFFFLSPH